MPTKKIPLSPSMKRFTQGVTAAQKVLDAHQDMPFPDQRSRVALFWFYVGALAVDEYQISEQDDFANFIHGVLTRAPSLEPEDDEHVR